MKRSMRLSEFLAEIGRAGGIAAHAASQYSEERLLGHCTFQKDQKSYKPDTIGIIIDGKVIPVPRYVLSRAGGLDLGQLKVEFEATVDLDSAARGHDPKAETNSPDTKIGVRFKRGLFRNDTHVKVEATFTMGPPPEAAEVVADRLNEILREAIEQSKMKGENDG